MSNHGCPVVGVVSHDSFTLIGVRTALLKDRSYRLKCALRDSTTDVAGWARHHELSTLILDASALDLDEAAVECAALREALPEASVLVLVARAVEGTRDALVQAGAAGVVLRGPSLRELICAVHQVHRGGTFVSEALTRDPEPVGGLLTPRQAAVLGLIAKGLTTKGIAARLKLGTETVDTHVEAVLRKLNAANRPHAVFLALSHGLL